MYWLLEVHLLTAIYCVNSLTFSKSIKINIYMWITLLLKNNISFLYIYVYIYTCGLDYIGVIIFSSW